MIPRNTMPVLIALLGRCALVTSGVILLGSLILVLPHGRAVGGKKETPLFKGAKSVTVEGKEWPSDQTDYPIEIICHKGHGKDNEQHVFLGGEVRDDFGDVRFRSDAGPLDYWLEECRPGKTARFWVKVPSIPKNGKVRIHVQFGNPEQKTTSHGKKTFPFFDDFLGDYAGQKQDNLPPGWKNTLDIGGANHWIVKDGILRFRGSGHLVTANKVWPNPTKECFTLRFRAKWPDPPFVNSGENGESIGGVSRKDTDGNSWMCIFAIYQNYEKENTVASFGRLAGNDNSEPLTNYVLRPLQNSYKGDFFTYEIERKPKETIARVIGLEKEVRSTYVISDELHLMIHACSFDVKNSPYFAVDWMLLRKQAYSNPSYGDWK